MLLVDSFFISFARVSFFQFWFFSWRNLLKFQLFMRKTKTAIKMFSDHPLVKQFIYSIVLNYNMLVTVLRRWIVWLEISWFIFAVVTLLQTIIVSPYSTTIVNYISRNKILLVLVISVTLRTDIKFIISGETSYFVWEVHSYHFYC